jgi:hypothetical protein
MRANCIQIHQETHLLFIVAKHIGEELNLIVKTADELKKHPETKTWDGMGRFAKSLYDNTKIWDAMPEHLSIPELPIHWKKEKARNELLNCYQHLGGKNLDVKPETDLFGNKQ